MNEAVAPSNSIPARFDSAGRPWLSPARDETVAVQRDLEWDPLLLCVAGYILTSVGRVHQLFPALQALRPAILTGVFAVGLYLLDQSRERRARHLFIGPTKYVIALLVWMTLSVPGALVSSNSFALLFDNFIKTVVMYFVMAGAVRGIRDVDRLAFIYLLSAAVYATVVIFRFEPGSRWECSPSASYTPVRAAVSSPSSRCVASSSCAIPASRSAGACRRPRSSPWSSLPRPATSTGSR
jgi:hypothetical protein